jgi:hypothetical protein
MNDKTPLPQISLSALAWKGVPTTFCADGQSLTDWVGTYEEVYKDAVFELATHDEDKDSYYLPRTEGSFRYLRQAFTETAGSDVTYYGGIICEAMSPLLRFTTPGGNHWPEQVKVQDQSESNVCHIDARPL